MTTMPQLYGIKNCDTVKKARNWLENHGCDYEFRDLRGDTLSAEIVHGWCDQLGWERILNKRSATWRQLPDSQKDDLDQSRAALLMLETPTLIKRPVLAIDGQLSVGFDPAHYQQLLGDKG